MYIPVFATRNTAPLVLVNSNEMREQKGDLILGNYREIILDTSDFDVAHTIRGRNSEIEWWNWNKPDIERKGEQSSIFWAYTDEYSIGLFIFWNLWIVIIKFTVVNNKV